MNIEEKHFEIRAKECFVSLNISTTEKQSKSQHARQSAAAATGNGRLEKSLPTL